MTLSTPGPVQTLYSVSLDKTYKTGNYLVSTVELISDFWSTSWFDNIRVFPLLKPLRVRQLLSQLPRGQGWRGPGQLPSFGQGEVTSDHNVHNTCLCSQLCGRSIPSTLHSSGASISFRLHTTRGYCGSYDLTYSSSEAGPGCGSEVGGTRGVVTSPGYPGVTNTSGDCWWVVRVPRGQRIQLRSVSQR